MAEQTELPVPKERGKRLGPLVTNAEIVRRTTDANTRFLKLEDNYRENGLSATGTLPKALALYLPMLVPDQTADGQYVPDRGNIRLIGQGLYQDIAEHIYSLPDLDSNLQEVATVVKNKGLPFVYAIKRKPLEDHPSGIFPYNYEKTSLNFAFGTNATDDVLEETTGDLENATFDENMDHYGKQLQQKKAVVVRIDDLTKENWPNGFRQNKGPVTKYSASALMIDIPYTSDMDVQESIASVTEVFDIMQKTGLMPLSPNPTLEVRFAKEAKLSAEPPIEIAYTEDVYNTAVQRLKNQEQQPSNNPFAQQFLIDLQRVPLADYREAVRLTNLNFPSIKGADLVARMEICEVGKTKAGEFVPLLPASDYLPPEGDYRNDLMHSRVMETWGDRNLVEQLEIPEAFVGLGYRAYFVELASGVKLILIDAPDQEKPEIFKQLQAEYGISNAEVGIKANLDTVTYQGQISTGIEQDTRILAEAGIPQKDIDFYKYWSERFYLTKDSDPQATYDNVRTRYNGLRDVVLEQKKANKAS